MRKTIDEFKLQTSILSKIHPLLFITSTDTNVGKSFFTALVALTFLEQNKKVAISKPVQTGLEKDTDLLKNLTNSKVPIFNTYSFKLPAAPLIAAKYENQTIETEKIISEIRKLENEFDSVIVEGIGGIAVPIKVTRNERQEITRKKSYLNFYLVADLIKDLNFPTIIVSRPTLGTINHTVLTIEFAKQKGLNILGFVVSPYDVYTNDEVIKTAPDVISKITNIECLAKIPPVVETQLSVWGCG